VTECFKNILLVQLGDIGDVVLTTPTIHAVKKAYSGARVSIMVREPFGSVLQADPNLHEVLEVPRGRGLVLGILQKHIRFIRCLRRNHYDLVIDLRLDDRGRFLSFLTGARERISRRCVKPNWHNLLFTRTVDHVPSARPSIHPGADQSLGIVRAIGIDTDDSMPKLYVSDADRRYAESMLAASGLPQCERWFTFNPFSRWKYKEWTDAKWVELINRVWESYRIPMLVVGSEQESSAAEAIIIQCAGGARNLCGGSIGEMSAIIATSSLHIGVDSAAPHIATALGVPTVTIHGPQGWQAWRMENNNNKIITAQMDCVPCNKKGCDHSGRSQCLESLEAEAVFQEMEKVLSARNKNQ